MSDSDDIILALGDKLSTIDRTKIPIDTINKLKALMKELTTLESIDESMVSMLRDIFRDNSLITTASLQNVMTSLVNASTVVYFKSAQMCKIYNKNEIETLLEGQLRTMYKRFKDAYEVVPNSSKQKIVIMCDITIQNKINSIKSYITEFMHVNKKLVNFSDNDIICYNAGNVIHIVLTNYYVNSSSERESVVLELVKFIRFKEANNELSKQIMSYIEPNTDFDNADIILMPTEKLQFSGKSIQFLDGLISNIHNCDHISSGKTIIFNINNIHNTNITDNSTNTTNITNDTNDPNDPNDPVHDFIEHIKENKPKWYTPNKYIDKEILKDKYEKFANVTISKPKFHNLFFTKLFDLSKREMINGSRIPMVKLKKL